MRSNFNTAPTSAPDLDSSWDYGSSLSWGTPESPAGVSGADWGDSSWDVAPAPVPVTAESNGAERLGSFKDKIVHGMGRKALDAVMNRLPSFKGKDTLQATATNLYEDPTARQNVTDGWSDVRMNAGSYKEQAGQFARSAGREVAGAGAGAAKEAVMKYYGLEKDENEKLRIARKLKFGKAVVKTVLNPVGTASSVGIRAGRAAKKAARQEVFGQLKDARSNFVPAASVTPDLADW